MAGGWGKPTHLLRGLIPVRRSQSRKVEIQHKTLCCTGFKHDKPTKRLNDYTVNVWSAKLRHCLYRRFGIALYLENSDLATSVAGAVGSSHLSVHWAHVMNCTTLQLPLPRLPCFCDTRANCLLYEVVQLLSDS